MKCQLQDDSPQLLFLRIKLLIYMPGNHLFHPYQSCVFLGRVIDMALAKVFANMRAVMIGFDEASHALTCFVGVNMQRIEEFADIVQRFKLLLFVTRMSRDEINSERRTVFGADSFVIVLGLFATIKWFYLPKDGPSGAWVFYACERKGRHCYLYAFKNSAEESFAVSDDTSLRSGKFAKEKSGTFIM